MKRFPFFFLYAATHALLGSSRRRLLDSPIPMLLEPSEPSAPAAAMVLASDEFGWSFSFIILEEEEEVKTRHATVGARLDAQKAGQCCRRRGRGAHPPLLPRHQGRCSSPRTAKPPLEAWSKWMLITRLLS
uniref:Uncharacterized protein n=1 Tax=Oryza punctata TaxID=4537 RepID=A0A0E0MAY9_ORYPU